MVVPGIDNKESDDGGYHEQAQAHAHNTLLQKFIGTIPRKRKLRFHHFTILGRILRYRFNFLLQWAGTEQGLQTLKFQIITVPSKVVFTYP